MKYTLDVSVSDSSIDYWFLTNAAQSTVQIESGPNTAQTKRTTSSIPLSIPCTRNPKEEEKKKKTVTKQQNPSQTSPQGPGGCFNATGTKGK